MAKELKSRKKDPNQTWKEYRKGQRVIKPVDPELMPTKYKEWYKENPEAALKAYLKELVANLYTDEEIVLDTRKYAPEDKIILILKDLRLEMSGKMQAKSKGEMEGFLEMVVLRGMKKCLDIDSMGPYFAGAKILATLYGVGEKITVRPDYTNPLEAFGENFIKAKLEATMNPSVVEARLEEINKDQN